MTLPTVTVVIPIFNEEERIDPLVTCLRQQTYPQELLQILFVDNMSTDSTREKLSAAGFEPLLESQVQNADAARNRAIEQATGEIIAFTDADCMPDKNWINAAIRHFRTSNADLVAGEIQVAAEEPGPAELYDIATNLRHDRSVTQRHVAFTANLFVRRHVIDHVGFFRPFCGGDHEFTLAAHHAGYRLDYSAESIVSHPARGMADLMNKGYRIGREKGMARSAGEKVSRSVTRSRKRPHFEHLSPAALGRSLKWRYGPVNSWTLVKSYTVGLMYIVCGAVGMVTAMFSVPAKDSPSHSPSS